MMTDDQVRELAKSCGFFGVESWWEQNIPRFRAMLQAAPPQPADDIRAQLEHMKRWAQQDQSALTKDKLVQSFAAMCEDALRETEQPASNEAPRTCLNCGCKNLHDNEDGKCNVYHCTCRDYNPVCVHGYNKLHCEVCTPPQEQPADAGAGDAICKHCGVPIFNAGGWMHEHPQGHKAEPHP